MRSLKSVRDFEDGLLWSLSDALAKQNTSTTSITFSNTTLALDPPPIAQPVSV